MRKLWYLLFCVVVCAVSVQNSKILAVFPMHSHSHFTLGFSLVQELVKRGHEVTFISPYPQKTSIPNLMDISVESIKIDLDKIKEHLFKLESQSPIGNFRYMSGMGQAFTELSLATENVQKLLKSKTVQFDVILVEHFVNEAQFAFGHHFNAPVVLLSPMPTSIFNNHLFANPASSSYVHNLFAPLTNEMSFHQRLQNTYYDLVMTLYQYFDILPKQKETMKKFFPNAPTFEDIMYNSSIILVNSHPSFSDPVPLLPNMIEIGGYHVLPPKKLPHDIQTYLDDAKNGVVLFSMGSILKSAILSKEKLDSFIKAFSKLKESVLWKFDKHVDGLPANVKIMDWIPQNDVLAHPNVKAFVTHGGLLSTIETIYHGIPVVGIPVFSDQKMNIASAVNYGYAINVPFDQISEELLSRALEEILVNPKYRQNAEKRSRILHDQQVKPIDSAIYWIEYVIRHRGAPHLQCSALQLHWWQRSLLDIGAFVICIFSVCLIIIYRVIIILAQICKPKSKKYKRH